MSTAAHTSARWGFSVADVMSYLHPSAFARTGADPDAEAARPVATPSVRVDASVAEAAAEFLRTGAIVMTVVDPASGRPIGLVCRRALRRRRD